MDIGSVHAGLKVHAKNRPNDVAVVYGNKSLTFRELYRRVTALANSLLEMGIQKGDHVALYMRNRIEMMEALYAISTIGAVSVPINYMVAGENLATLLNQSDARYIFVEIEQLEKFEHIIGRLDSIVEKTTILIDSASQKAYVQYEPLVAKGSTEELNVAVHSSDLFAILFSSGTTSEPKGIMVTHEKNVYRILRSAIDWKTGASDVMLITVPIYHAVGFGLIFRPAILGVKVVITREFDPETTLRLIERQQISQAFFVPPQYVALLQVPTFAEHDLRSLQLLISAGSPLAKDVKKRITENFGCGLLEFFGSSETGAYIIQQPKDVIWKTASIGQQVGYMEVRLLDGNEKDVGIGEEGEFAVRGPLLFCGYYKQADETEEAFLPGGWFKTGDMGKVDGDGFYYLLDRKKDMIISGGVNVYPRDIEQAIHTHPDVLEVAVIGIPDEKWGEAVKAYVVLRKGRKQSENTLITFANSHLANYQKVKELVFLEKLPRNPSGKILKRQLREAVKVMQ